MDRSGGGQHQHAAVALLGNEPTTHLIAHLIARLIVVYARKVAVEHDHVVIGERGVRERLFAIGEAPGCRVAGCKKVTLLQA